MVSSGLTAEEKAALSSGFGDIEEEPNHTDDFEVWFRHQELAIEHGEVYYLAKAAWNASRLGLIDKAQFNDELMKACEAYDDLPIIAAYDREACDVKDDLICEVMAQYKELKK